MGDALRRRDADLEQRLGSVVSRLMEHRKVLAHLTTLRTQTERALGAIDHLSDQYCETEPDELIRPMPAESGPRSAPSMGPIPPLPAAPAAAPAKHAAAGPTHS